MLNEFSDKELAFFYKYKFQQYSDSTRDEIEHFIFSERNLSLQKIEYLIKGKINSKGLCKRCGSAKAFSYDIEFFPSEFKELSYYKTNDFSSDIIKKEQIECFVCGYIIFNPNENSLYYKIRNFLKNIEINFNSKKLK